jgi:hypothetical protein
VLTHGAYICNILLLDKLSSGQSLTHTNTARASGRAQQSPMPDRKQQLFLLLPALRAQSMLCVNAKALEKLQQLLVLEHHSAKTTQSRKTGHL